MHWTQILMSVNKLKISRNVQQKLNKNDSTNAQKHVNAVDDVLMFLYVKVWTTSTEANKNLIY